MRFAQCHLLRMPPAMYISGIVYLENSLVYFELMNYDPWDVTVIAVYIWLILIPRF